MVRKLNPTKQSRGSLLQKQLSDVSEDRDVYLAANLMDDWRYIDFVNPVLGTPCISLEYLFGSRGVLTGRVMKLEAPYGTGKSSFMFYIYGCAQKCRSWCYHAESEAAPPPGDFIASFGADPNDLVIEQPASLEKCLTSIDDVVARIRGGFGGEMGENGRMKKSKYTDPLDAKNESPIVIGVDSVSGLGLDEKVDADISDPASKSRLASHSAMIGEFFRNRMLRFKRKQVLLMMAAQQRANIKIGPMAGPPGPQTTTLGATPIGYHATYIMEMKNYRYADDNGNDIGERIHVKLTKNKVSPKNREIVLYLVRNQGFDLMKSDLEFLLKSPVSPLNPEQTKTYIHAGKVTCELLGVKAVPPEEFLRTFYASELLPIVRQTLRIRGFGFDFEKKLIMSDPNEENTDGVDGSTGEVQEEPVS